MKNILAYILPALFLMLLNCSDKEPTEQVLATVGNRVITVDEFTHRAEFSPERLTVQQKYDKKQLLDILLNEKLLAIGAEEQNLDQTKKIKNLSVFIEEMAIQRALFRKKIQAHVQLDPVKVEQAIDFSQQERIVSFLYVRDKSIAEKYHKMWQTMSFHEVLQDIYGANADTLANRRLFKWGENDPVLEETVFNMALNELSGILRVSDGYMILRCDDIQYNKITTESKYTELKSKVKRILTARQEARLSAQYVSQFMQPTTG